MKRPAGTDIAAGAIREEGDPSISFPWNFQHRVHVDESLNGLPSSWAAQLGVNVKDETESNSPTSPTHEKPSLSYGAKSRPLRDVDPNVDTATGLFCLPKRTTQNKPVVIDVPRQDEAGGDPGISTPWGFKHNIHVDENYTGLPTDWSKPAEAQRINSLLDMSPEADAAISVPWNFKHGIHVFAGSNGIPTGLPPALVSRLGELGFSEGEIAAIRAAS
ncbi:hypothetical protein FOMPIDRAFT_1051097 [Fomitopsis schrenkii]|uniref:CRIB domain-containing protein n=1 Tax=Fomitopsis schrenkii TaxID=2126942 RepID=S8E107_FOMSC|nr:hypothetical protein FOMPIDRAFT_1051097 [Fomitopsis schrenkii]